MGLDGDYGFAPANYIDLGDAADDLDNLPAATPEAEAAAPPSPPRLPQRPAATQAESSLPLSPPLPPRQASFASDTSPVASPPRGPQAALANVLAGRSSTRAPTPPPITVPPARQQYLSDESEEESSPALPPRPRSNSNLSNDQAIVSPRRTSSRRIRREYGDDVADRATGQIAPGGFHMYNINEMVSVMGKKKKMPTTLGVNLKTGAILIAPERSTDGPTQEWTADRMTHYSREGKHVFLELVRPSRSIDFHAGAKDTAEEIVSSLGELSGAVKAEGLREVIMAGSGHGAQRKGIVLYDFMAQGDDEVTVAVGDEVLVLDDAKSEEWWQVRRLKNGKEGVVPSIYIEITETIKSPSTSGLNAGRDRAAQNRLEEERLAKEALRKDQRATEVGPGMRLPERNSSLSAGEIGNHSAQQRSKRENGRSDGSGSRSSTSKSSKASSLATCA